MKKLSFGVLCALGILGSGCDMDIPNDQVGTLSTEELCIFSGGTFENDKSCHCGTDRCGENVTCAVDTTENKYVCMTSGNMEYPQYTCTLQGMTLCFDRIIKDPLNNSYKTSGYFISCDGTAWSSPSPCENGFSCRTYLEHDVFYASECGVCNNDNDKEKGCIRGTYSDMDAN